MCSGLAGTVNAEVKRHFCQSCGSICLVSLHLEGTVRCSLLPAGVLSDASFPKEVSPKLKDIGTQSPAPFGPLFGMVSIQSRPQLPISGSCLCGACRFRTQRLPREMQHCHCSMCRQMSGAAYQTWTPVPKAEVEWIKPNSLREIRASRHALREFCQECGSALTIIYANQRGTMWISAAAYEKAAFAGMCSRMLQRQSMHICTDSAPPWHTPKTWESEPDTSSYFDAGTESEDEEEHQLQQALQISQLDQGSSSSSSSTSGFNPQLAILQEMTGCSLLQAEQALATYGSADVAAEALLGAAGSSKNLRQSKVEPKSVPSPPAKKLKRPPQKPGEECQSNTPVWRGAFGQLRSSSCIIDLCG